MHVHIGYIITVIVGLLVGYFLYLYFQYKRVSEVRQVMYFILPTLPLGIITGIFEAESFSVTLLFSYFIGFFTCLIVQMEKNSAGNNIDDVKRRLNTVFVKSVKDGNLPAVQALLDAGADVNSKSTHFDEIALIVAAEKVHIEVIRLLLNNGADVNAKDEYGRTALMGIVGGACSEMFFKEVKSLQEGDVSSSNHVPLSTLEIINILLENGADINAKDIYGRTVMDAAQKGGYDEIVQLLKKASTKAI